MQISLNYQGKETTLTRPETPYGSNIGEFTKMLSLALEAVGLSLNGTIEEMNETQQGTDKTT